MLDYDSSKNCFGEETQNDNLALYFDFQDSSKNCVKIYQA